MLKQVLGRLRCVAGKHERSRSQARLDGDFYISVCKFCGLPMRKSRFGDWTVEAAAGEAPLPAPKPTSSSSK